MYHGHTLIFLYDDVFCIHFFINNISNNPSETRYHDSKSPTLSCFEIFPENNVLQKPTLFYTTQNPNLLITFLEGYYMHTGNY